MYNVKVGDITLLYDKNKKCDIDRILKILKLNLCLFSDYKNKVLLLKSVGNNHDRNIIPIVDFDLFFEENLYYILQDLEVIQMLNNHDFLQLLYIQLLVRSLDEKETFIPVDESISDDTIYFWVACKYFDYRNHFNDLVYYLKYRKNTHKLFNWLKETQRFNVYNYLLNITANYMERYNLFLGGQSILNIMDNIINKEKSLCDYNQKIHLPQLSMEDFENIFFNFLIEIGAPQQWQEWYQYLKMNHRIFFEESRDGKNQSQCYIEDGIIKIKITTDGTILFFISFVHEFIHSVTLQSDIPSFFLREISPIFYEKMAAYYLTTIGYNASIIKKVSFDRNQSNANVWYSLSSLLLDIEKYKQTKKILRSEKIELGKKMIKMIQKNRLDSKKQSESVNEDFDLFSYKIGELVDKDCDTITVKFIKDGIFIIKDYQYLIGSFIADYAFQNMDEKIVSHMSYITDHLTQFDINSILEYLEIDDNFISKQKEKIMSN